MNKRIRELAEKAELNVTLLFNKEKLEKFAELIVKETIDEMITQMWNYGKILEFKAIDLTIQEMLDVSPSKD